MLDSANQKLIVLTNLNLACQQRMAAALARRNGVHTFASFVGKLVRQRRCSVAIRMLSSYGVLFASGAP